MKDRLRISKKEELPPPVVLNKEDINYPYGVLIGPQGAKSKETVRILPRDVVEEDADNWMGVERGQMDLVLMGILQYQDVLNITYELKFCAVFHPSKGWLMKGDDRYNSHKKIT